MAFASMARAAAVLVRNGEAKAPWLTKQQLLEGHAGAYTTARTVDRSSIFELSMHCTRLYDTGTAVLRQQLEQQQASAGCVGDLPASSPRSQSLAFLTRVGADGLKPMVRNEIQVALDFLGVQAKGKEEDSAEYQVTHLLTWDTAGPHTPGDRGFDFFTFVQQLPALEPMVSVEAHRAVRSNPTIKDVQWVSDRQYLEEIQRKAAVNEVLMFDDEGNVTEGLQTNFFAIAGDGTLLTAPDSAVLAGTVRKVVLEVAARHGLAIRLSCPNIADVLTWESCFICSTSRLVKPILEVRVPQPPASASAIASVPAALHREFAASGSVAHRVEELVKEAVRLNSEPIASL